jgi:hypothetical protein
MQGLCEADGGTRTPGPFITSEERRLRMSAAGSSFACSEADLSLSGRTAFAAVSGCSIAHSLPTLPTIEEAQVGPTAARSPATQVRGYGLNVTAGGVLPRR